MTKEVEDLGICFFRNDMSTTHDDADKGQLIIYTKCQKYRIIGVNETSYIPLFQFFWRNDSGQITISTENFITNREYYHNGNDYGVIVDENNFNDAFTKIMLPHLKGNVKLTEQ